MSRKDTSTGKAAQKLRIGKKGKSRVTDFVSANLDDDDVLKAFDDMEFSSSPIVNPSLTIKNSLQASGVLSNCESNSSIASTNLESFCFEESQLSPTSNPGEKKDRKSKKKRIAKQLKPIPEIEGLDGLLFSPVPATSPDLKSLKSTNKDIICLNIAQVDTVDIRDQSPELSSKAPIIRRGTRNVEDKTIKAKRTTSRSGKATILLDSTVCDSPLNYQDPSEESDLVQVTSRKSMILKTPSARLSTDCFFSGRSKPASGRMKLLKSDGCFDESPASEDTHKIEISMDSGSSHLKKAMVQQKGGIKTPSRSNQQTSKRNTRKAFQPPFSDDFVKSTSKSDTSVTKLRGSGNVLTDKSNAQDTSANSAALHQTLGKENIPVDVEAFQGDQTVLYSVDDEHSLNELSAYMKDCELSGESKLQSNAKDLPIIYKTDIEVETRPVTSSEYPKKQMRDVACEARLCCSHVNIGFSVSIESSNYRRNYHNDLQPDEMEVELPKSTRQNSMLQGFKKEELNEIDVPLFCDSHLQRSNEDAADGHAKDWNATDIDSMNGNDAKASATNEVSRGDHTDTDATNMNGAVTEVSKGDGFDSIKEYSSSKNGIDGFTSNSGAILAENCHEDVVNLVTNNESALMEDSINIYSTRESMNLPAINKYSTNFEANSREEANDNDVDCDMRKSTIENSADMLLSDTEEVSVCNISLQTSVFPVLTQSQLDESDDDEMSADQTPEELANSPQCSNIAANKNCEQILLSKNHNMRVSDSFIASKVNFSLELSSAGEEMDGKLVVSESFEEVSVCNMSMQTSVFPDVCSSDTSDCCDEAPSCTSIHNSTVGVSTDVKVAQELKSEDPIYSTQRRPIVQPRILQLRRASQYVPLKSADVSLHHADMSQSYLDVSAQNISIQTSMLQESLDLSDDNSHNSPDAFQGLPKLPTSPKLSSATDSSGSGNKRVTIAMPCDSPNSMSGDEESNACQIAVGAHNTNSIYESCAKVKQSDVDANLRQVDKLRRDSLYTGSPNFMSKCRNRRRSSWLPGNFTNSNRQADICSSTQRRSQIAPILDELDDLSPIAIAAYYEGRRHKRLSTVSRRVTLCGLEENDSVEQVSNSSGDIFYTPPPGESVARRRSNAAVILLSDTDDEEKDSESRKRLSYGAGYKTACREVSDTVLEEETSEQDKEDSDDSESADFEVKKKRAEITSDIDENEIVSEKRSKKSKELTSTSPAKQRLVSDRTNSKQALKDGKCQVISDDDNDDDQFENFLQKVKVRSSARELIDREAKEDDDKFIVNDDEVSENETVSSVSSYDDEDDDDDEDDYSGGDTGSDVNSEDDNDDDNSTDDDDNCNDNNDDNNHDSNGDNAKEDLYSSNSDFLPDLSPCKDRRGFAEAKCIDISDDEELEFKKPAAPVRALYSDTESLKADKQRGTYAIGGQKKTGNKCNVDMAARFGDLSLSSVGGDRTRAGPGYYDVPAAVPEKLKRTPIFTTRQTENNGGEFALPALPPTRKNLDDFDVKKGVERKTKSVDEEFRTPVSQRPSHREWYPHSTGHSLTRLSFLESLSARTKPENRHVEAQRFVKMFVCLRQELSDKLFKLFNENVFENKIPADTPILWNDRMTKSAGYCSYKRQHVASRTVAINLSVKVCDNPERLRDTLIHEMCHAAVWIIHGINEGHGKFWKYWAHKANRVYRELPAILRCHSYKINTKYIYRCTKCGYELGRHSKSLDTTKKICGYCRGSFELLVRSKSQDSDGASVALTPGTPASGTPYKPRAPNDFALFVKENYRAIMDSAPGSGMKETMRKASELFALRKAAVAAESAAS